MYRNKRSSDDQNFWISYADLMAGLLFVFVLIVGAILIRYLFAKADLEQKRTDLMHSKTALKQTHRKLTQKEQALHTLKNRISKLSNKLSRDRDALDKTTHTLSLKNRELEKLKALLLGYELNQTKLESNLTQAQQSLAENEHILKLKDEEVAMLSKKLMEESKAHQVLVEELNITKVKIKNLTGIRIKVIKNLKERLGNSIDIDPKSGAIRFSSNILFNKGSYKIKPEAKKQLQKDIKRYIDALLLDPKIRDNIDKIIIEGHTDTDGSYLYNLELSQKRALSVLQFIYKNDPKNRNLYKRYLSASGRSFADLIRDTHGRENKDASRRIEVKFRIKNQKAIQELENFLDR